MANMVTKFYCHECGFHHKISPYHGYVIGVDLARDDQGDYTAVTIGKVFPDLQGGLDYVILDVIRQPPDR